MDFLEGAEFKAVTTDKANIAIPVLYTLYIYIYFVF